MKKISNMMFQEKFEEGKSVKFVAVRLVLSLGDSCYFYNCSGRRQLPL
jgi:hypothetical protein